MVLDFINPEGKFYKNAAFIGYTMIVYTNGELDLPETWVTPKTHKIIWTWRFDND